MKKNEKGMLITAKVTINVTNDGETNLTSVEVDKDATISEIFTSLEMARDAIRNGVRDYIVKTYGAITEKELIELMNNKFSDIFKK